MGTSPAKTKANRKNARKSTGPKTAKGKRVVKYNALKHGLLAREAVLTAGDGQESQGDFKRLLESLVADMQPIGSMEEMLVERIAICYWRLRRAIRAEAGEIRKLADNAVWTDAFKRADSLASNLRFLMLPDSRTALRRDPRGLDILINLLRNVRDEIECSGELLPYSHNKLTELYGLEENTLAYKLIMCDKAFSVSEASKNEDASNEYPPYMKKIMLGILDEELSVLKTMRPEMEKKENLELEAERLALSLPDDKAVARILRYETTIERQLYRAVNQLERLQRARKGDTIPPPINVELSANS
jgi:hypothetical protein